MAESKKGIKNNQITDFEPEKSDESLIAESPKEEVELDSSSIETTQTEISLDEITSLDTVNNAQVTAELTTTDAAAEIEEDTDADVQGYEATQLKIDIDSGEIVEDKTPKTSLGMLFYYIKNWFKGLKQKMRKKKFSPLSYNQVTRFEPDIDVGLTDEQVELRKEQCLYNVVSANYSKS